MVRITYLGFAVWMFVLAVALCSCVSYDTTYHSQDGRQYFCRGQGYGIIGSTIAIQREADCDKAAKQAGFSKE